MFVSVFITVSLVPSGEPSCAASTPAPVPITRTAKPGFSTGYATSPGDFGVEICGYAIMSKPKYVMLLDWTGRELRRDKRGAIPDELAPILDRLGVDRSNRLETVRDFGRMFKQTAGRASSLVHAAPRSSRRWFQGKASAQLAFI